MAAPGQLPKLPPPTFNPAMKTRNSRKFLFVSNYLIIIFVYRAHSVPRYAPPVSVTSVAVGPC